METEITYRLEDKSGCYVWESGSLSVIEGEIKFKKNPSDFKILKITTTTEEIKITTTTEEIKLNEK